jgi:hypothetical protein
MTRTPLLLTVLVACAAGCRSRPATSGNPPDARASDGAGAVSPDVAAAAEQDGGGGDATEDEAEGAPAPEDEPLWPASPPVAIPPELLEPLAGGPDLPLRAPPANAVSGARRLGPAELPSFRPRFSPDGARVVFFGGTARAHDVYAANPDGSDLLRLTDDPGDDRDPTWDRSGERILWSSNRGGSYDLWSMRPDGTDVVRVTELPGDELEPAVSPLRYRYLALVQGDCGAYLAPVGEHDKLAFTRRHGGRTEVWFLSTDGFHRGRISPEDQACSSPAWPGSGLQLAWVCGAERRRTVHDAAADWDHDAEEAMAGLAGAEEYLDEPSPTNSCPASGKLADRWRDDSCLLALPRRYSRYAGPAVSSAADGLADPAYSANQILLLAATDGSGGLRLHPRAEDGWTPLTGAPAGARHPDWSPDGARLAFDAVDGGRSGAYVADADFYLQDVRDLVDYPELHGEHASPLLHRQAFVARPGEEREFFVAYEKLRYAQRAPFITADAALQAFHDEFTLLLRAAEETARRQLRRLTRGLYDLYSQRLADGGTEADRRFAVHFAVPWVLLEASRAVRNPAPTAQQTGQALEAGETVGHGPPVEEQFRTATTPVLQQVAEPLRDEVRGWVERILAHEGLGTIVVPGRPQPVPLDFGDFVLRGHYAAGPEAGYFIAAKWLGLVPLPLDESAFAFVATLDAAPAPADEPPAAGDPWERTAIVPPAAPAVRTLGELWDYFDRLAGTMMGRPVDVAIPHLRRLAAANPELLSPFQAAAVTERLAALRGPLPFRGLEGALTADGEPPPPAFVFLPRRYGLDQEFFHELTHPTVAERRLPQALDVFAALGNERAAELVDAAESGRAWVERYRAALAALRSASAERDSVTLGLTDLYHSWLAALATLARPAAVPAERVLRFARNQPWRDRQLLSALAGYAQLKHDTILYGVTEYVSECGGDEAVRAFVEQPIIPEPRPYVDPLPAFFHQLGRLADRGYRELYGGTPWAASFSYGLPEEPDIPCARDLADRLAIVAAKQLRGLPVTEEESAWMRFIGAYLEMYLLRQVPADRADIIVGADEGRTRRGVALVADVFHDPWDDRTLEVAIGRILDLYVAVPDTVGLRMTQGGLFSYHEFTQPLGERLTDDAWNELLERGAAPPIPAWTSSFVEPRPAAVTALPALPATFQEQAAARAAEAAP